MKPLVHSHTSLASFELCPKQWHHKYVLKDVPYVESEAMKWGNTVHTALELRVRDKKPLPEEMAKYEKFCRSIEIHKDVRAEEKLGMGKGGGWTGSFAEDCWFRGKVDVAILADDTAFIIDYKTGKRREDPTELEEHAMLLKASMPDLQSIKGMYLWLQDMKQGTVYTLDPVGTLKRTRATVKRLEENLAKDFFPAHDNPLCNYCPCTGCEFNGKWRRR